MIFMLSQLQSQIIIFGVSKEKEVRDKNIERLDLEISNNIELKKLKEEYNFEYSKEKFGDFFVISIKNDNNKKILILLKPIFNDIFIIPSQLENRDYQVDNISNKDSNKIENILRYMLQIDKWYIIAIITIFGLIVLYKRFRKLKEINSLQKNFKDNQDIMQGKLDNIM